MRISKYIIPMMLIFTTASFMSCKKSFLEIKSPTTLLPDQALKSESDLQVALRGIYASYRAVDFYGRTIPVLGDIMADNTYQSSQNTNRYTLFNNYTFNVTDGNVDGIWNSAYNTILRANNAINAAIPQSTNVDQYKGEAYALRALAYFTLVRLFAKPYTEDPSSMGVPIVTTYDPDFKPGRSTVAEVYTLIQADLTQAFSLMAANVFTNSSQFSKYAAKALQAKVYLTIGDKTNAKTAALDVINNGGFVPVTAANYVAYWNNPAIASAKGETLYEVSSDAVNNLAFDALPYIYTQGGNYGDLLVSSEFVPCVVFRNPTGGTAATGRVNLNGSGGVASVTLLSGGSGYGTAANTLPTIVFAAPPFSSGTTATATATVTGGVITGVTIDNPGSGYKELLPIADVRRGLYPTGQRPSLVPAVFVEKYPSILSDRSDTKVLRLSEMYLIAAEASLPGNEADALTYVNFITSRRGAATISSTGAQLLEDVLTERRKELAFEGDRYFDLQRLKRDVVRSVNYPSAAATVPFSNYRRILPIPQRELNSNPTIRTQQNSGY